jgi:hypothetical protein
MVESSTVIAGGITRESRSVGALALVFAFGCQEVPAPEGWEAETRSGELDKELPNFPLYYHGAGNFFDTADPANTLIGTYTFDMERGMNYEHVRYIDREIIAIHVFDLDPSDGTDPDREYLIDIDEKGKATGCALAPFPLPNVFSRDWWLHNDMVYQGTETINGFLADCWEGVVPEFGAPARYCNRADVYPDFAPLLKVVATFEFYDYFGRELESSDVSPSLFGLPKVCRDV